MEQPITGWCLEGCDWLLHMFIEINFSKLTDSKKNQEWNFFSKFYPEVCCVRLKFGFVSSSSYWVRWWSGLWVGREGRNAVDPFWWKAVQGSCRSAIHLLSVPQSHHLCLQVTEGEAERSWPTDQLANRRGLGTCDALLCVSHTLQSALEIGQEARIDRLQCHFWQGQPSGDSLQALFCGSWKFSAVCPDTVSL